MSAFDPKQALELNILTREIAGRRIAGLESPRWSAAMRCAALPWVKLSGTTGPCVCFCSVSSPIASAARMPSSRSPGSEQRPRLCVGGPHPGIAVGLKLNPDLNRIACGLGWRAMGTLRLARASRQILDMVADFVRDHIGHGEIARRPEALRSSLKKVGSR